MTPLNKDTKVFMESQANQSSSHKHHKKRPHKTNPAKPVPTNYLNNGKSKTDFVVQTSHQAHSHSPKEQACDHPTKN